MQTCVHHIRSQTIDSRLQHHACSVVSLRTYLCLTSDYELDGRVVERKETEEEGEGGFGDFHAPTYTRVSEMYRKRIEN